VVPAILNLNHVWLDYPIGGYLGLMGGDPKYSYDDIIEFEAQALERALDANPDVQRAMATRRANPKALVDVELWFFGYSQSADGMKRAVARLFGPGGKYELIRDRINRIIVVRRPHHTRHRHRPPRMGVPAVDRRADTRHQQPAGFLRHRRRPHQATVLRVVHQSRSRAAVRHLHRANHHPRHARI
jgi:hypothetical protein